MAIDVDTGMLDGEALRLLRVARRVTTVALARHYGASRQAVAAIESRSAASLNHRIIGRYLSALEAATVERSRR